MVKPSNDEFHALGAAVDANPQDLVRIRTEAGKMRDLLSQFSTQLLTLESSVPSSTRADIESLRRNLALEVSDLGSAISGQTDADVNKAINSYYDQSDGDGPVVALIRSDLGLPPAAASAPSPTPTNLQ